MPSYIRNRAEAKEAYLRGLATRASAGVVTTTTPTTSSTTVPQAVVPWVPPASTTARPQIEQPRQQDAVVSSLNFFNKCIKLFVKIVGEMQCTSLPLLRKRNIIFVGIFKWSGGSGGGGGHNWAGDDRLFGGEGCPMVEVEIPMVDGPCWGSSSWVCFFLLVKTIN